MFIKALMISFSILIISLSFVGCETNQFTLSKADSVLNLSAELSPTFVELNSDDEGFSKQALGLGAESSDVSTFFSEDPYQIFVGYLAHITSTIQRATLDAEMASEQSVIDAFMSGYGEPGPGEPIVENIVVTLPSVGDMAARMQAEYFMDGVGTGMYLDVLSLKQNDVYVYLMLIYEGTPTISLNTMCESMAERITAYEWPD